MTETTYRFDAVWDGTSFLEPGYVTVSDGCVASIDAAPPASTPESMNGAALPGIANLHSHAFQRAMTGLAERRGNERDSFWTWRSEMYRIAQRIDPDQLEAIATQLYVEMLRCGYTSVAEFHYLHHPPDGDRYADPAELSQRIIRAALSAGIDLILLPVLYEVSGFEASAPLPEQRRFTHSLDEYLSLVDRLERDDQARIGVALHSLRAVRRSSISAIHQTLPPTAPRPLHIHIAEQPAEVDECVARHGRRPVELLYDTVGLSPHHCLVHATHIDDAEVGLIANAQSVVGLCPTTEANLGDGIPPIAQLLAQGGRLGVGSDSHISVALQEELRWLEYAQRLTTGRRNVLTTPASSTGARLYRAAQQGGATAVGLKRSGLLPGAPANLIVLDTEHPSLYGRRGESLIDAWVFSNQPGSSLRHAMVHGRWVIRDGRHPQQDAIATRFRTAMAQLGSG